MTDMTNAAPVAATSPGLPDDQRRLIELDDAIAKIRTQIATADLARQRGQKSIDPDWFHNTLIGVAVEAVASGAGDTIGRVRLNATF